MSGLTRKIMFSSSIGKLESRLGHAFADQSHLQLALTHSSYSKHNNERLEFFGDAVLNLVVAEALFHKFDTASEGELSRLRASLVKKETLAEVARELDLGSFVAMGAGELQAGSNERDSVLADTLEAVICAILLDAGYAETSAAILRWYAPRLEELSLDGLAKDAKSRLQEHLQALGEPLPEYRLIRSRGKPPAEEFEVACSITCLAEPAIARGSSKRGAEQEAASQALVALGVAQ